jgi:hypothetical protein
VSFAQGVIGIPARISSDVKNRDIYRRSNAAITAFDHIKQGNHGVKPPTSLVNNAIAMKMKISDEAIFKYV